MTCAVCIHAMIWNSKFCSTRTRIRSSRLHLDLHGNNKKNKKKKSKTKHTSRFAPSRAVCAREQVHITNPYELICYEGVRANRFARVRERVSVYVCVVPYAVSMCCEYMCFCVIKVAQLPYDTTIIIL